MRTCTVARRPDARRAAHLVALVLVTGVAQAQEATSRDRRQLANPIARLASLTFENDQRTSDGTLTMRALLPIELSHHWYLVSRTDLPLAHGAGTAAHGLGLENSTASLFLASADLAWRGVVLGVGPILAFPASDDDLGAQATALGAIASLLYERGPAVYGLLAQHVWSLGGGRSEIEVEPQLAWVVDGTDVLVNLSSEATRDDAWSIVAIAEVGRVVEVAGVNIAVTAGPLIPVEDADWGFRTSVVLVR